MKYRSDIDGLRAVAVALVLGFHAFPTAVPNGFIGVDIFFVISGFLITSIILTEMREQRFSFVDFYRRRAQRLFPALATVVLSTYAFGWLTLYAKEFAQLGQHIFKSVLFVANFAFWNESGYFDNVGETKPLLHLWSLGIEEQFYLAWPLLLLACQRTTKRVLLLVAILLSASFIANVITTGRDPTSAFFLPHTRFWELLVGASIAAAASEGRAGFFNDKAATAVSLIGCSLILATIVLADSTRFPGWWAVLPVVGSALIILSPTSVISNALSLRPFVAVGKISYPLYLWHWPLLSFVFILEGGQASATARLCCLLAAVVLAAITYATIEQPFRRPSQMRPRIIVVASPMIVLFALGLVTAKMDGFAWRLGSLERIASASGAWDFPGGLSRRASPSGTYYESSPAVQEQVLFIGDSTVSQYGPRAVELAKHSLSRNAVFFTRHGCLVIDGAAISTAPQCATLVKEAVHFALSDDRIKTVVIGSQWFGGINAQGAWSIETPDGLMPIRPGTAGYTAAMASLDRTIAQLRSGRKTVVLLLPTPFGEALDPKNAVSRKLPDLGAFISGSAAIGKGISAAQFRSGHSALRSDLVALAEKHGAIVVEPSGQLCDKNKCPAVSPDGEAIYMNSSHLNPEFVRKHVTYLDCVLQNTGECPGVGTRNLTLRSD